ncbi:adenylate cyclase [Halogeometricum pallidum JCM 14848]|uniref:Adenylate cyclase n=1 Tax=Halogeometricum pallidum JCM 14848 TaxID=1227487 RepID=M0DG97_HALPD|nr:class IV adenylate cyclase [Halogeometricum pallidum]ELZ34485.1 adenylate cyclase [Halogeometricum pallidum JCM 14848]
MYEVEVKLRADHETVRARLAEAGAVREARTTQVDTYYDAPHRDFAETDEALRIRRETRVDDGTETADGEETTVTYKGPLVDEQSKTRSEHETAVEDGESAENILSGLSFEPVETVEKEREFFSLDGYTVTLDAVADLGEFVEVEMQTEDDVDAAREGAFDVLRRLGLDPNDQIRTSYLALLLSE